MSDYEELRKKYELLLQDVKEVVNLKKENIKLKEEIKEKDKELLETNYLLAELLKNRK